MTKWMQERGSAAFLSRLAVITAFCFVVGLFLTEELAGTTSRIGAIGRGLGVVLVNLSGVGVAAVVTTLFFNFHDVRSYMSDSIARLFSDASVVTLLSPTVKSLLRRRLAEDAIGFAANESDASLFRHLTAVTDLALQTFFVSNLNCAMTITGVAGGLRKVHNVTTYRVHAGPHLARKEFPLKYYYTIVVPSTLRERFTGVLESAVLVVGDRTYSHADFIQSTSEEPDGAVRYRALLEKEVTLAGPETDVRIELHALASDADPTVSYAARYPTSGFTLTVIRDTDHTFDAVWFMSCATHQHVPDKGSIAPLPSGLSVRTNDWVLPGEGVTVSFYRKPGTGHTPVHGVPVLR